MSIYTTWHAPISGVDKKLKDKITCSQNLLIAEIHKGNRSNFKNTRSYISHNATNIMISFEAFSYKLVAYKPTMVIFLAPSRATEQSLHVFTAESDK